MKRPLRCALFVALALAGAAAASCSSIGDPGAMPDALPHGGTGQFRVLDAEEVGIFGSLAGRAIALTNIATESAMPIDGYLFYSAAPRIDDPPRAPDRYPRHEIFWDAFEPRRIHRGEAREEGTGAFASGPEVLAASATWEGDEVFDPWVTVDDDGTARLYYAAAGGIGVATAPSVDGDFTRVGDGPIIAPIDGEVGGPRRPSVIRGPDGAWWMYYDSRGAISVARSDDGVTFTQLEGLVIEGEDLNTESREVRTARPGALSLTTAAGRVLVRMYFESLRGDGSRMVYVAGSEDGLTFQRHPLPVMDLADARFPVPVLLDARVTFLYANAPFAGSYQTRAVIVAVSPAGERFDPPPEPPPP